MRRLEAIRQLAAGWTNELVVATTGMISRELYVAGGGRFRAALVSGGRTLSSDILVDQLIEYTPVRRELEWVALDPLERRHPERTLELRKFVPCIFHEQSHRLVWRILPPAPRQRLALSRYLTFAEALVIATDMALSDELGPKVSLSAHRLGVIYFPGTRERERFAGKRAYRAYLHALVHALFLNLEGWEPAAILASARACYGGAGRLVSRAVERVDPHAARWFALMGL
ncbi:MAG: hypothetical protein HY075_04105 [Deltaproteobacteria bacterium]|nr:hypothetical protein [Deltaproteobacteria bacterium]